MDETMIDDLIRLQVRVQQLETVLRDISQLTSDPRAGPATHAIHSMASASLPAPPAPATEAHAMRELQVSDDDTA